MDVAADIATQTRLRISKMKDSTSKGVNAVVGGVLNQLALKKRVEPTVSQVKAQEAALEAEKQREYVALRQSMLTRYSSLREKVQNQRREFSLQMAARQAEIKEKHHNLIVQSEEKRAQRRARDKALGETGENFGI